MTVETDQETMLTHYITCALWSSMDNADESGGDPLDQNYGPDDLHPDTRAAMLADCSAFLASFESEIGGLLEQAGHDLWLTRNGHGSGFWDCGRPWSKDAAKKMTDAAHALGESDLYIGDDGLLHV